MDEVELCIEFSGDQGVARFALVMRNQACLSNADDQVRLPVIKARTAVDDGWTLFDQELVGIVPPRSRPSWRFLWAFWQCRVRCGVHRRVSP